MTTESEALAAARIRAINEFGPRPGEYVRGVGDLRAAFERARKRQQEQTNNAEKAARITPIRSNAR